MSTPESRVADDVTRGQRYVDAAKGVVSGIPDVARGAAKAFNTVTKPLEQVGLPILHAAGNIGSAVMKSPRALKTLVGTSLAVPILLNAFSDSKKKQEQDFLMSSQNPERVILAADTFITARPQPRPPSPPSGGGGPPSKAGGGAGRADLRVVARDIIKAIRAQQSSGPQGGMGFFNKLQDDAPDILSKGILTGIGTRLVDTAFSGVAALGKMGINALITNPQRQRIFEEALRTDTVLQDAIQHNPEIVKALAEAFATLVRFAPSLALDINAVRSYLREAVISGGGINYATVKQLADTEKVIQDRNRGGNK